MHTHDRSSWLRKFCLPVAEATLPSDASYVEQLQSLRERAEADGLFPLSYFLDVALVEAEALQEPRPHIRRLNRGTAVAGDRIQDVL